MWYFYYEIGKQCLFFQYFNKLTTNMTILHVFDSYFSFQINFKTSALMVKYHLFCDNGAWKCNFTLIILKYVNFIQWNYTIYQLRYSNCIMHIITVSLLRVHVFWTSFGYPKIRVVQRMSPGTNFEWPKDAMCCMWYIISSLSVNIW